VRFLLSLLLLFANAVPALAQSPGKPYRVGVLTPAIFPEFKVFKESLAKLGYSEGTNVVLDVRNAGDRLEQLAAMAAAIVKASPDVILAVNTPGVQAAMAATKTIPIVMVAVGDPVATGFVSNLARPDKNATGLTNLCGSLAGKRLAMFKSALPGAKRFAVIFNASDPITAPQVKDAERSAPTLGVEVRAFPVRSKEEVAASFGPMMKWKPDGIMWLCGQQRTLTQHMLPEAARHRLPVMVTLAVEVPLGGLISYGTENAELYRRAAVYVDKILKGAKVADLPVEQPTKFELVVNLKAAKALGVSIPQPVILQADRVIE
jgi:putative ABC transport system substrate-binding protein